MGCSSSNAIKRTYSEVEFKEDFFDHYLLETKLGQGNFAQVRLLSRVSQDDSPCDEPVKLREVCAKILDLRDKRKPGRACPGLQDLAAMEADIAKRVGHHPNCVDFYGAYIHSGICFMTMEKCDCSLYEYMREHPALNERSLGKTIFAMVSGLHHLHSLRVVHRDIKPDNFMVGGVDRQTVKICDFGLSAILPEHGMLCGPVGTTPFMCPEMFIGHWYNEKADIWSLGVTVYVFLYGQFPYEAKNGTSEEMAKAIIKGNPPSFEPAASPTANKFVQVLLQRVSEHRPGAEEILNLPYLVSVMTSRHMKNTTLPSLEQNLNTARRKGAVRTRDLSKRTELDEVLSAMQLKSGGVKLPLSWKSRHQAPMVQSLSDSSKDLAQRSISLSTISEDSTRSDLSPEQSQCADSSVNTVLTQCHTKSSMSL